MSVGLTLTLLSVLLVLPHTGVLAFLWFKNKTMFYSPAEPKVSQASGGLSVVVPFRNELARLPALLKTLESSQLPEAEMEFIFVDDHSEDRGEDAIVQSGLTNARVIHAHGQGKKEALLTGIRAAAFETIYTLDADCLPGLQTISEMHRIYSKGQLNMLCGPVHLEGQGGFRESQALESAMLVAISAVSLNSGRPATCNGANLMFDKKVFFQTGAYASDRGKASGDDDLLMHRFAKHHPDKVKYTCSPACAVTTAAVADWKDFMQQRRRWASKHSEYLFPYNRFYLSAYVLRLLSFLFALFCVFPGLWLPVLPVMVMLLFEYAIYRKLRQVFPIRLTPGFYIYQFYPLLLLKKTPIVWKGREIR